MCGCAAIIPETERIIEDVEMGEEDRVQRIAK